MPFIDQKHSPLFPQYVEVKKNQRGPSSLLFPDYVQLSEPLEDGQNLGQALHQERMKNREAFIRSKAVPPPQRVLDALTIGREMLGQSGLENWGYQGQLPALDVLFLPDKEFLSIRGAKSYGFIQVGLKPAVIRLGAELPDFI